MWYFIEGVLKALFKPNTELDKKQLSPSRYFCIPEISRGWQAAKTSVCSAGNNNCAVRKTVICLKLTLYVVARTK